MMLTACLELRRVWRVRGLKRDLICTAGDVVRRALSGQAGQLGSMQSMDQGLEGLQGDLMLC